MRLIDLFNSNKPVISFEIFPPKVDTPLESIYETLEQFKELNPDFISVTYGAGGSGKSRTIEIASKIKRDYGIETMAHFTCVGHTQEEIDSMLDSLKENGLQNILALRGDPPVNQPDFDFSKNTYQYASELIRHIRSKRLVASRACCSPMHPDNEFCVAAAAYVEGHVDCARLRVDLENLKRKVDEGVDFLVTQLFFDNRLFFDFQDKTAAQGICCPITPGIMPVFKADQIKRITSLCGASIPAKLVLMMDKYQDNAEDMRKAGVEYASLQIRDLLDNGVDGIHLLTMNRPKSTREILQNCGLIK